MKAEKEDKKLDPFVKDGRPELVLEREPRPQYEQTGDKLFDRALARGYDGEKAYPRG